MGPFRGWAHTYSFCFIKQGFKTSSGNLSGTLEALNTQTQDLRVLNLMWCKIIFIIFIIHLFSLPPGAPAHAAACPNCTSRRWRSSCGHGGPSGSHLGCQRRSGRCAWPRPGDPGSSVWFPCSSRPLAVRQNFVISVKSRARALKSGLNWLIGSLVRIHPMWDVSCFLDSAKPIFIIYLNALLNGSAEINSASKVFKGTIKPCWSGLSFAECLTIACTLRDAVCNC